MKEELEKEMCKVWDCDPSELQVNITLNPDKEKIMQVAINFLLFKLEQLQEQQKNQTPTKK